MKTIAIVCTFLLAVAAAVLAAPREKLRGDPIEGRASFVKLRCDNCHSVYGQTRATPAPHPLRDLSGESPAAIAHMIVARTHLAPGSRFDEQVMSVTASGMVQQQLADIVAYLRVKR